MDFFQQTYLRLFTAAQDAFDNAERALFDQHEANKVASISPDDKEREAYLDSAKKAKLAKRKEKVAKRKEKRISQQQDSGICHAPDANVTIRERETALAYAKGICSMEESDKHLVYWTDASVQRGRNGFASCAAAFKQNGAWNRVTGVMAPTQTSAAELHSILLALEIAVEEIEEWSYPRPEILVKIFTDSQTSLHWISGIHRPDRLQRHKQKRKAKRPQIEITNEIIRGLDDLRRIRQHLAQLGVQLEFHWVPRGKIEGNKIADAAAYCARIKANYPSGTFTDESLRWNTFRGSSCNSDPGALVAFGSSLFHIYRDTLLADRRKATCPQTAADDILEYLKETSAHPETRMSAEWCVMEHPSAGISNFGSRQIGPRALPPFLL